MGIIQCIYHFCIVFCFIKGYPSCYVYLRGFALEVVKFTFEVLPSRLLYLPSRFHPQGCYHYLPSRFRPQGCYIYLRGFALEVVVIFYLRGFVLKVDLFLPLRFRPQGYYCYFWGFAPCFFLGIHRACWCVNVLSDIACPCSLFIYISFISLTVCNLNFLV